MTVLLIGMTTGSGQGDMISPSQGRMATEANLAS